MNANLKTNPHAHGRAIRTNTDIIGVLIRGALFVAVWAVINRYLVFGVGAAIHVVLMVLTAMLGGTVAHFVFDFAMAKLERRAFDTAPFVKRFKNGETILTGLILAIAMQPGAHLYVVFVNVMFAEIFGKLIYGGYGQNIFNPVAVGLIFNALTFGGTSLTPSWLHATDITTGPTPLAPLNAAGWQLTPAEAHDYLLSMGGAGRMLLGAVRGSVGETSRLALLLALVYMLYKRVVDWATPVCYFGSVFVMMAVYGLVIGAGMWYPVIHLLTGGVILGGVFLATDPVTIPLSRQGRAVFGILLAFFTLMIRLNSGHAEGVAFSILLMNMLVAIIDSKTSVQTNSKKASLRVAITFVASTAVLILFTLFVP